jgi:PII-like signaling protein
MMPTISTFQPGKRLRLFLGESQSWQGHPLYRAILDAVYHYGAVAATVQRGIEGFGPEQHLSTERLGEMAENLPVLIEIIETEEDIDGLLTILDQFVQRGLITMTPVSILVRDNNQ